MHHVCRTVSLVVFFLSLVTCCTGVLRPAMEFAARMIRHPDQSQQALAQAKMAAFAAVMTHRHWITGMLILLLSALGMGVIEALDWRGRQRMAGHHAHMLSYAGSVSLGATGVLIYLGHKSAVFSSPAFLLVPFAVAAALGFLITAGLASRGVH